MTKYEFAMKIAESVPGAAESYLAALRQVNEADAFGGFQPVTTLECQEGYLDALRREFGGTFVQGEADSISHEPMQDMAKAIVLLVHAGLTAWDARDILLGGRDTPSE